MRQEQKRLPKLLLKYILCIIIKTLVELKGILMEETRKDFISMDKVLKLLELHTAEKPVLDLAFMAVNRDYIEHGHNFTIHLVEKVDGKNVNRGTKWVEVIDDRDKYNLRAAIKDAVKRTMNLDLNFDYNAVAKTSTVVDPESNPKGKPVYNDPAAKDLKYDFKQGDLI